MKRIVGILMLTTLFIVIFGTMVYIGTPISALISMGAAIIIVGIVIIAINLISQ